MARAFPVSQPTEFGTEPRPGDWQALRGELVALLDQVEGQYADTGTTDPAFAGFAQRMRDLRYQVADTDPDDRRREALRSVKRQVERFNERGEPEAIPPGDNVLQSAIQQIRARTQADAAAPRPMPPAAAPAPAPPRFEELAHTMSGLTGRLGQLETELGAQRGNAMQVREIADQVGQLSHVVELLAGAVGETGQVKRLESQIAGLGQLIAAGSKVDLSQLTERLDQVSATVDRLADLQVQQIQHVVREAEAAPHKDIDTQKNMQAIEAGVRNIYDRIDTLESSVALAPAELERISDLLGHISSRVGNENARPERLLGLVDALNGRINDLEDRGEALAGLKSDIGTLRDAVLGSVEPRFAAIETQLGAIGDKLASRPADGPGVAQLEAQIRLLVARMDQTGEQLSSLAAMQEDAHSHPAAAPDFEALASLAAARTAEAMSRNLPPPPPLPDLDDLAQRAAAQAFAAMARHEAAAPALPDLNALADLVASRTSDAMGRRPPMPAAEVQALADIVASKTTAAIGMRETPAAPPPALSEASLGEIEARISRLVEGFVRARAPEGTAGMQQGMSRVEERLSQLESSLLRDATERKARPADTAPLPPVAAAPARPAADAAPAAAPAPAPAPASRQAAAASDSMPRNPSADAPLKEFGFPDLGPVRAALEAKNGPRKQHPGIAPGVEEAPAVDTEPVVPETAAIPVRAKPVAEVAPPAPPQFDPASVPRPPRPESSLEAIDDAPFATPPSPVPAATAEAVPASTRNTFIEAARRAAQRQDVSKPQADADSLIGRALARFQPAGPASSPRPVIMRAPEPVPPVPAKPESKAIEGRADKPARAGLFAPRAKPAAAPAPAIVEPVPPAAPSPEIAAEKRSFGQASFLLRHRKPILIGASLVAVSFMTLNLVMQRLAANDGQHVAGAAVAPTPAAKPSAKAPAGTPAATAAKPAPATDNPAAPKPISSVNPAAISPAISIAPTLAVAAAAPAPRIVPSAAPASTDAMTTASIDPNAPLNYASSPAGAAMPPALAAANSAGSPSAAESWAAAVAGPAPAVLDSPVKVELPPDSIGPLELRQAAADGDARSQFEIAAIYSEGRAIPQDFKEAGIWYERAAAQGFAPAQYRLGNLYETGKGVDKDFEQARLWYQRAAEAGNRMAMHNLAALYAGGQFGKQDFGSAANWFQQAADRGMKDSQFNLGMLYARGLGVPQSLETSYKWFGIAALTGDADAAKARDNVARSIDAEALKRAAAEIAAWKPAQIDLAANFAPIGTWQKDFNPGPAISSRDVVMKVQAALVRLGYDVGTADGHAGPKTTLAIKAFERGTGMTEIGAINPRLLAVLGSQPV